jgi:hypothetical protein
VLSRVLMHGLERARHALRWLGQMLEVGHFFLFCNAAIGCHVQRKDDFGGFNERQSKCWLSLVSYLKDIRNIRY